MITKTLRPNAHLGLWVLAILLGGLSVPASAQVRRNNGIGVTVYVNPNFSGQSASFRDDTPSLVPYGLNDKISSIQIPAGETWEVCQDVNYGNQCQVLTGSVSDLRSMGWNDRISSLRRINGGGFRGRNDNGVFAPGNQQGLMFFTGSGFRGRSTMVNGEASNLGMSARQGSVQLRGGGPWELCDNTGRCAVVTRDISDLSQLGLNGRITTVRLANRNRGNNRDRYYGR